MADFDYQENPGKEALLARLDGVFDFCRKAIEEDRQLFIAVSAQTVKGVNICDGAAFAAGATKGVIADLLQKTAKEFL